MSYPDYSRAERIADGMVHVIGVVWAIAAVWWLIAHLPTLTSSALIISLTIYSLAMLLMLSASALYHLAADTSARPLLRRLDHAAIYLKIAGTFTPLGILLGSTYGYVILGLVWAMALIGAWSKLTTARGRMTTSWWPYCALGWIGVALFIPLSAVIPAASLTLMLAGGLLYTAGVAFYCAVGLKYANAIWHVFTLVATGCFFTGISSAAVTGLAGA